VGPAVVPVRAPSPLLGREARASHHDVVAIGASSPRAGDREVSRRKRAPIGHLARRSGASDSAPTSRAPRRRARLRKPVERRRLPLYSAGWERTVRLCARLLACWYGSAMRHVLVVDDRADVCTVVQTALEGSGVYRVSSATEVAQARSFLERDPPDLLILDAVMPGRHGFGLATDAAERGIPIVMMTGEPVMNEVLDEAGWSHLRKPFHLPHLLAETRRTLLEAHDNLRMVRGSLRKMSRTASELKLVLGDLRELRRRAQATLDRSRRREGAGEGD
jgi:DNA-binding response OmpR family regulator